MTAIPDHVCSRDNYRSYIEKVVIPESVTWIGWWAFYQCNYITNIDIPEKVKTVAGYAFQGCTRLESVKFAYADESVVPVNGVHPYPLTIGTSAFSNCSALTTLKLSANITSIGDGAFSNCSKLGSLELPKNLKSIGYNALSNCSKIVNLTIPESVTSLGAMFIQGTGISSITIPKNVSECKTYNSYEGPLAGSNVTEVVFEEGMTAIPSYVCSTNNYKSCIEKVVIPESVTSMGYRAFYGCNYLKLTIYGSRGSYAELYATENNINFKTLAVSKTDTSATILDKFDIDDYISDIDLGSVGSIEGPTVKVNGKEFPLFKLDAAGLKLTLGKHVDTSIDTDKKVIRCLIGFKPVDGNTTLDPSEDASGAAGSKQRSEAWNKQFSDMKNLYQHVVGGEMTDAELKQKLQALNRKLYDADATLGLSAQAKVAGYLEISYASGEFYVREGGVIVSASVGATYSQPIAAFPAAYVALEAKGSFNGAIKLVRVTAGYNAKLDADLSVLLGVGLGLGSKRAKSYVEGGLQGELVTNLKLPATSLEKALAIRLNGTVYIASSLFGFDGPGYSHRFAQTEIYPRSSDETVTFSLDDLEAGDRSYLENQEASTASLGEDPSEIYSDASVYPRNAVNIVTLPGDRKLMVWVGDDGTKSLVNRTSIMYAVYDGAAWSETQILAETGGLNDYPIVSQAGDAVYIVWQKADQAFADGTELTEVLKHVDLYYAVYQDGEMSEAQAVTAGSSYEMMQQVAVNGKDLYVAWVENSENDIYMTSGTTSIRLAECVDGKWNTKTVYSGTNDVANLTMDMVGGKLTLAFELGQYDDGDNYSISLYLYQDGNIRSLCAGAQNSVIADGVLYYIEGDRLVSYDLLAKKKTDTGIVNVNDFEVVSTDQALYVVVNTSNGGAGELFAYTYNRQTRDWSDAVQLTEYGKYIRNFSVTVDSAGTLVAALNLVEVNEESTENRYGDAVLKVVTLGEVPETELGDVIEYDASLVQPGGELPLKMTVSNHSLGKVSRLNIQILDRNNVQISSGKAEVDLEAGGTEEVEYSCPLPETLKKQELTVKAYADGEGNMEDNCAGVVIGAADVSIESAYLSGSSEAAAIKGTLKNKGMRLLKISGYSWWMERIRIPSLARWRSLRLPKGKRRNIRLHSTGNTCRYLP